MENVELDIDISILCAFLYVFKYIQNIKENTGAEKE